MKKLIYLLAAGALALAACSETEVLEQGIQSSAIGFNTLVSKNSRAIDDATFTSFKVYGAYSKVDHSGYTQLFDGVTVRKEGSAWTYDSPRYWIPKAEYTFAAYACEADNILPGSDARANYVVGNDAYYELNLAGVHIDGKNQKDIVYAKTGSITGQETGQNEVVALSFNHILSRIKFKFVSRFPPGYIITVKNVKVRHMCNTGTFKGKEMKWDMVTHTENVPDITLFPGDTDGVEIYEVGTKIDGSITTEAQIAESGWCFVIPYSYTTADVGIVFAIEVKDETEQSILGKPNVNAVWKPNWEYGKSYAYTVNIAGAAAGLDEIKFSGSVTDWTDGIPTTPEFNVDAGNLPAPVDDTRL